WATESVDLPDMRLPDNQDALIQAVAKANPKTTVVLETNGPVRMPWAERVPAVLQAWYPGIGGGEAIANLLTGTVNPSGHLPVTWPVDESQLPRPSIPGLGFKPAKPGEDTIDYAIEGANVGYKWFAAHKLTPRYPFGHGLSYTQFRMDGLRVEANGSQLTASFEVENIGQREGAAVPQLYVTLPDGHATPLRLIGWQKLTLKPGEKRSVQVVAEPKTLADFDAQARRWTIAAGTYRVQLARSASEPVQSAAVTLQAAQLP
ncbi:glycosyl hydrolase, partial [Xanthomonas oryzae pv. oryzae]